MKAVRVYSFEELDERAQYESLLERRQEYLLLKDYAARVAMENSHEKVRRRWR